MYNLGNIVEYTRGNGIISSGRIVEIVLRENEPILYTLHDTYLDTLGGNVLVSEHGVRPCPEYDPN